MFVEIILGSLAVVILFILLTRKPKGLPPALWGWPVIGHLPSSKVPFPDQVEDLKQKLGKTFLWRMGTRNFVILCDYKIIKATFSSQDATQRPEAYTLAVFAFFKKLGFANNHGQGLLNLRRFTMRHMKDSGMGKSSIEGPVVYELQCLIDDFKKHTGGQSELPWSINVAVINVIWKILADKRYDVDNSEIIYFEKLINDLMDGSQSQLVFLYDMFPLLDRLVPNSIKNLCGLSRFSKGVETFQNFIKKAIEEHQESLDVENPRDFIDSYLIEMKANEQGNASDKTNTFHYEDLLIALSDMFSAGSETTSSTIRWIFLFLAKYPEVQNEVHREIDRILPSRDRLPSLKDKDKLNYTMAVIHEVMRIMPLTPFGLYHSANHDIIIDGFHIPKDTILLSSILSCHMDPDYWNNPKEFRPQRFLNPDGSFDTKKEAFIPFSIGRRSCIGEALARAELFIFITGLLQAFTFTAPEGVELDISPNREKPFFFTPNPFPIIITERI